MNVLILTPDRVGSTLLQRLITVYMQAHKFDQPVINLHELTNGLMKYYSPVFNAEVLGKPNGNAWGYYQSLGEITELLHSVKHYKTSRLAHYHIKNRQDTIADQVPFYQYLNDNFFIISARRENLLEHALSWCIQLESKKLNVYSHQEKVSTFQKLYQNKIHVDNQVLVKYLNQYKDYLTWVENHFSVSSYFNYEQDLLRLEEYILGLNIFNGQQTQTWNDIFNLEFRDWNMCHYLVSDLSGLSQQLEQQPLLSYDAPESQPEYQLQSIDRAAIPRSLSTVDQKFLIEKGPAYTKAAQAIEELVQNKIMVTSVPIKLQTMLEKKLLVKNFDQCVETYNNWVKENGIGKSYATAELTANMQDEIKQWHATALLK
jgi:hypothetical protein